MPTSLRSTQTFRSVLPKQDLNSWTNGAADARKQVANQGYDEYPDHCPTQSNLLLMRGCFQADRLLEAVASIHSLCISSARQRQQLEALAYPCCSCPWAVTALGTRVGSGAQLRICRPASGGCEGGGAGLGPGILTGSDLQRGGNPRDGGGGGGGGGGTLGPRRGGAGGGGGF